MDPTEQRMYATNTGKKSMKGEDTKHMKNQNKRSQLRSRHRAQLPDWTGTEDSRKKLKRKKK